MTAPKLRLVDNEARGKASTTRKRPNPKSSKGTKPTKSAAVDAPAESRKKANEARSAPKKGKRVAMAADLMSSPAIYCSANDTLNSAAQLLWDNDLGALVVVDEERHPISMITDRDICFAAYTQGIPLREGRVESAMSRTVLVCATDTPVAAIREHMLRAQVRRLPVVDQDGTLVGVVSLGDLMSEATRPLNKSLKRGSSHAEMAQLVAAVLARPSPRDAGERTPR